MFRKAIGGDGEYKLVEFDYKSFHAQTLGYEAGDPSYIRLARIDIHSYVACMMLKLPKTESMLLQPDEELKAFLKWHRKNYTLKDGTPFERLRGKQAKPAILGYGFGMGAKTLYVLNTDSFTDEKEAQKVLDTLDSTFPLAKRFRDETPLRAHRDKKLISKFGSIRWFWDVRRFDPAKGGYVRGKDWEPAIAFLPATDAFGHIKLCIDSMRGKRVQ
jgi:hypothetical protein